MDDGFSVVPSELAGVAAALGDLARRLRAVSGLPAAPDAGRSSGEIHASVEALVSGTIDAAIGMDEVAAAISASATAYDATDAAARQTFTHGRHR